MDNGYQTLAAHYVRRQAKLLAEQLDGVRAAEDIEFVHRARVASRRLRAALRMFDDCFRRKQVKRWRKAVRRLTQALGEARDRDVQIEWLCGTLATLTAKECFPGAARVLVQLEHQRERLQHRVVAATNHLEAGGDLDEMRRAVKRILAASGTAAESRQTPAVLAKIRRHVLRRLDELLEHQDSLSDADDRERHHAMRIAAKRLRYTLEISRPAYPGRLDAAVETMKRVQTLLGEVHDCDVWLDHLDAFIAAERRRIVAVFGHAGRFRHFQAGIACLQEDRRAHRRKTFEELVEYWTDLERRGFWDELRAVVGVEGKSIAPSEAPPQVA